MQSSAKSVSEYIKSLPEDRKKAITVVRAAIRKSLPKGYEEVMQYGMISYVVPLSLYPDGYLGDGKTPLPYVSLASQKGYMSVYLMGLYADSNLLELFVKSYAASGKKLNMGKSCVRFKNVENLPLNVLSKAVSKISVSQMIKLYEKSHTKKK